MNLPIRHWPVYPLSAFPNHGIVLGAFEAASSRHFCYVPLSTIFQPFLESKYTHLQTLSSTLNSYLTLKEEFNSFLSNYFSSLSSLLSSIHVILSSFDQQLDFFLQILNLKGAIIYTTAQQQFSSLDFPSEPRLFVLTFSYILSNYHWRPTLDCLDLT